MRSLVVLSVLAVAVVVACSASEAEEAPRSKRGIIGGFPSAVSYSSQLIHHTPAVPVIYPSVKYVAPVVPAVKVVQPYPIAKIAVAPAVSYTKVSYPAIIPHYGYGYGFSHYH